MSLWLDLAVTLLLMPVFFGAAAGVSRLLGWVALLLSVSTLAAAPPSPPGTRLKLEKLQVESTNRVLLLKTKKGISTDTSDSLALSLGLKPEKHPGRLKQWRQFSIPPGKNKHDIITTLKRSGRFDEVMEPKTYTTQATPNDPMFPQLWGLTNIAAPLAWDRIKDAQSVVVAVVDTGIDVTHPDLAGNLWVGPNGEHGYTCTNGTVIAGGLDDHGHGTHVAGTIGAMGNNLIGIVGVAWRTKIIGIKVLHHGSGNSIDIVNGYERIVELKESGVPIVVANHSYGGGGIDPYMRDGFELLDAADVFSAVAAGNSGQNVDTTPFSPASFDFGSMVVALASGPDNRKASFSNFGLIGSDLTAPGVGVLSTTPGNSYSSFSGTSMAAPHVAGVAVLLRQLNRGLTASQVRDVLLHPGSYDAGDYLSSTSGRLNAAKAVNNPKVFESPFITNGLPQITAVTPYTLISNTQPAIIQAAGSDPDGDTLKWSTTLSGLSSFFERRLLGLSGFFITNVGALTVVSGGPYAYQLASDLTVGASDQRGGSATATSGFEFVRDAQHRRPIQVKTWTAVTNAAASNLLTLTFDVMDEAKSNYLYGFLINFPDANIGEFWGNQPSPTPFSLTLGRSAHAFGIRVFCMDRWLNFVTTETIQCPSNSTTMPRCVVTVNTNEGNAPFDVVFDLSKSERARAYAVFDVFGFSSSGGGGIQTIPFSSPGLYFKMPLVFGNVLGEIDLTVIPVFASRFLGQTPTRPVHLAVQKAATINGPWSTFTNLTDSIAADTFYRLEAQ